MAMKRRVSINIWFSESMMVKDRYKSMLKNTSELLTEIFMIVDLDGVTPLYVKLNAKCIEELALHGN